MSVHLPRRSEEILYLIPSLNPLSFVPYFSEAFFRLRYTLSRTLADTKWAQYPKIGGLYVLDELHNSVFEKGYVCGKIG